MTGPTHYDTLSVAHDATEQDIVHAYRVLIRSHHPDIAGADAAEQAAAINHAYDTLRDPASRRDYDRELADQHPPKPDEPQQEQEPDRSPSTAGRYPQSPSTTPAAQAPARLKPFWATLRPRPRIFAILAVVAALIDAAALTVLLLPEHAFPGNQLPNVATRGPFLLAPLAALGCFGLAATAKARHRPHTRHLTAGTLGLVVAPGLTLWALTQPQVADTILGQPLLAAAALSVAAAATIGIVGILTRHRNARRAAAALAHLLHLADNGAELFFVTQSLPVEPEHTEVVLEHVDADHPGQRTIVLGVVTAGQFIALGDGGHVIATAPGKGITHWERLRL